MQLIDTHCHLTHNRFQDDVDAVIASAQAAGVAQMITIGTGLEDGLLGAALAARWPGVLFTACGLDPFTLHQRADHFADDLAALDQHLSQFHCVALGEVGLEYFHQVLPAAQQRDYLHQQLHLAEAKGLPVVIHVRDAHADMKALLAEHCQLRGVIHSFDGTAQDAEDYLSLGQGWMLSFNGMATFSKKPYLREALAMVPDDCLLIETDSPFLAPVPMRGKRCEPAFVAHTAATVAAVREQSLEQIAGLTSANARRLFAL